MNILGLTHLWTNPYIYFIFSFPSNTHTQTHLLQECVENRALLSHVLLLQGSSEVLQGDVRAVSP